MFSPGAAIVWRVNSALGLVPSVVVDRRGIGGAWIAAVVRPDALAGDELLLAVAVEIRERERVRLRP